MIKDIRGQDFPGPYPHIVSLVPSHTEALFLMGLGDRLVGRTTWCVEPAAMVSSVPTFGGTKDPDITGLIALNPDLIVVNREENRQEDVQALEEAGIPCFVTHPRTPLEGAEVTADLGRLLDNALEEHLVREVSEWLAGNPSPTTLPALVLIWRRPWMAAAHGTYISAMLEATGWRNVITREDPPYPKVDPATIAGAVVILPDEPYPFGSKHLPEVATTFDPIAALTIDGRDLCWFGPRVMAGLVTLRRYRDEIGAAS